MWGLEWCLEKINIIFVTDWSVTKIMLNCQGSAEYLVTRVVLAEITLSKTKQESSLRRLGHCSTSIR